MVPAPARGRISSGRAPRKGFGGKRLRPTLDSYFRRLVLFQPTPEWFGLDASAPLGGLVFPPGRSSQKSDRGRAFELVGNLAWTFVGVSPSKQGGAPRLRDVAIPRLGPLRSAPYRRRIARPDCPGWPLVGGWVVAAVEPAPGK